MVFIYMVYFSAQLSRISYFSPLYLIKTQWILTSILMKTTINYWYRN